MELVKQVRLITNDAERYRLLVDAVTDYAIYMLDPNGFVSSWNAGAQRFKGYTEAEILGHHFSRFYIEDDQRAGLPARALATALNEGRFENEGWRVRQNGERFWAHVVIDPILDPAGTLLGYAKITRDLSERRLAESSLRRSEEEFRLLVQSVTDYAIYRLDPKGYVSNWNLGAERIKHYLPAEIIGQHFSRFYTEEDQASGEPMRNLAIAVREGRFEKEGWRVRKDGSRFWANVVIDPIIGEQGETLGFAKITRDITEKRQAQLALEQTRETLFQSQKMEALGQLTGGIAHDFNNLLMVFLGSLELVRKRLPNDPRITPLLDNAIKGAQRGASLTQRMLAFARRQTLHLEPLDVPILVRGMGDLLQRSLGPTIAIECRFPLSLMAVQADSNQLELALLNLAVNARDALPGGGQIIIAAQEEQVDAGHASQLAPGRYICLSVTDHGEGMDAATLAAATEPFFTTKGVGKGTGLGLSMVHGLAEQAGGRLFLKSQPGQGTTAEIWLPTAHTRPDPQEPLITAELTTHTAPLTILMVDDDSLVLSSTTAMLEDLGHRVFPVASGQQALEVLRCETGIDLLITDQVMPGMTGAQLIEAVKVRWPALPIILATGYTDTLQGKVASLVRLDKPFGQRELARAIADMLLARPGTAAS